MKNEEFDLRSVRPSHDGTIAILYLVDEESITYDYFPTEFPLRLYQHRKRLGASVIAYSGFIVLEEVEYHILFLKNPYYLPLDKLQAEIEARLDELDRRAQAEWAIEMAFFDLWGPYPSAEWDDDDE